MAGAETLAMLAKPLRREGLLYAIGAALGATTLYSFWRSWRRRAWNVARIPGRHWLLEDLPKASKAMADRSLHVWISDCHRAAKSATFMLKFPMQSPYIYLQDPKDVEHMLKTNFSNYPKGEAASERVADLLGDGIFNADGELWFRQRKTASKMFTANKFKNHIWNVVDKNAATLVDVLRVASGGEPIDMFNLMNRFTLDTIGEIGFGSNFRTLEHGDSPFLVSFDRVQNTIPRRYLSPLWRLERLLQINHEKGYRGHLQHLDRLCAEITENLKKDPGDSFVGLFISGAAESGEQLEDRYLRDLILNFLIAGRDTSAQALAWSLYHIMKHPEVEQKLVEEVEKVCGGRPLTYDKLGALEYTQAVIYESLRLFPSVPQVGRSALADDTLPSGAHVPRGAMLWVSSFSMGRNPDIWGEDAAIFRPERWIEMGAALDSYHFTAFHGGPRECLGKRLATVEMKVAIVSVIRSFKFELAVPFEDIIPDVSVTISMYPGLPCHVRPR